MFVYIMKKEIKVIDMERILDAAKKTTTMAYQRPLKENMVYH